jgi:hypothetical protein
MVLRGLGQEYPCHAGNAAGEQATKVRKCSTTELRGHNSRGRTRTCDHPLTRRSNPGLRHRPNVYRNTSASAAAWLSPSRRSRATVCADRSVRATQMQIWPGNRRLRRACALRIRTSQPKLFAREVSVTNHHWPCEVRAGGICGSGIVEIQSKEPQPTPPSSFGLLGLLVGEVSN